MDFLYEEKTVKTNQEFFDALKSGFIYTDFLAQWDSGWEQTRQYKALIAFLEPRIDESPMIAWGYAKAVLTWQDDPSCRETARTILLSLAQQDFAPALYTLADRGLFGTEKSLLWMERAVELEYGPALYDVGYQKYRKNKHPGLHFSTEYSVKPFDCDGEEEGVALLKRAYKVGIRSAAELLAQHYAQLEDARMIEYCRGGVESCNDWCAYLLAECYRTGKFVERNDCYAAELYEKSGQWWIEPEEYDINRSFGKLEPIFSAYFALGEMHENNLLPDSSVEKAKHYFTLAAQNIDRYDEDLSDEDQIKIDKLYKYSAFREREYYYDVQLPF